MPYSFYGQLRGLLCSDCFEALPNVKVRLYRGRNPQDIEVRVRESAKNTFAILTNDMVQEKQGLLFAEANTDAEGNFKFELDERQQYDGGPFEIDVYLDAPPRGSKSRKQQMVQFTLTALQPDWQDNAFRWEYAIPSRFWCGILALFDLWTICGRVVLTNSKQGVAGVKVSAIDADWIQDDPLGSAITDATGHFQINYTGDVFRRTTLSPWINIDTPLPPIDSGPDVYFRLETSGGTLIYAEDKSRGLQPDRANIGNCFCVELEIEEDGGGGIPVTPWFTRVGDYRVYGDISPATGLTSQAANFGLSNQHGGAGYGFFGGLELRGTMPAQQGGQPMRYRFQYEHPSSPGTKVPITGNSLVYSVELGVRMVMWDVFGTGLVPTPQTIRLAASGATPTPTPPPVVPPGDPWGFPPDHIIVPDADGWIAVDQQANGGVGFTGALIGFRSEGAVPGGGLDSDASTAGSPAALRNGTDILLYFEAGPIGGATTTMPAATKVHVNNWGEVTKLNLLQFMGMGATACSGLTTALDIMYTADHELMLAWSIGISTAASLPPGALAGLPSGTNTRPVGENGTEHRDISLWPGCSYIVTLSTTRKLTTGLDYDDGTPNSLTFCKD